MIARQEYPWRGFSLEPLANLHVARALQDAVVPDDFDEPLPDDLLAAFEAAVRLCSTPTCYCGR